MGQESTRHTPLTLLLREVLDPAVLLVLFCTGLLINGTKASRLFTNVSTVATGQRSLLFWFMP